MLPPAWATPSWIAEDRDSGLALLRVYGTRNLTPLALAPDASKKGDITLVGIPDPKEQNGAKKLTEIKARLANGDAIELRQSVPMAGFSGAAALDPQGQVARPDGDAKFRSCQRGPGHATGPAYHCRLHPGVSHRK